MPGPRGAIYVGDDPKTGRRIIAPPKPKPLASTGTASESTTPTVPASYTGHFHGQYLNPPPDPRLNSIIKKTGSHLRPGIIQQTEEVVSGPQKQPFGLRFLFNPTTIVMDYSARTDVWSRDAMTPSMQSATDYSAGPAGLSFSLLFDRTYEVCWKTHWGEYHMEQIGVKADVAALQRVTGVEYPFVSAAEEVNRMQHMRLIPCYFIFGGGESNEGLVFYGHINNWSVEYTSFSHHMVPMRCAVTISATQLLGKNMRGINARSILQ